MNVFTTVDPSAPAALGRLRPHPAAPLRRLAAFAALLSLAAAACAQMPDTPAKLPDAPSSLLGDVPSAPSPAEPQLIAVAHAVPVPQAAPLDLLASSSSQQQAPSAASEPASQEIRRPAPACNGCDLDANGNPIPLERQQPHRILGFMPNFRTVSAGAVVHPPGWKYNFYIATRQAFDWSSFLFLGLTTISAEGLNEHPVLGKGVHGFYSYGWRGFLDKTDGTYWQGFLLPSLLHEDTRYYPLGAGHPVVERALYVISRQAVARTYGGHQTPNIAGLGGKVMTQVISRNYYPTGATSFGVLAEKFGYATMRDIAFSSIREFYPDIAAHYVKKHRQKMARLAAADSNAAAGSAEHQPASPETGTPRP